MLNEGRPILLSMTKTHLVFWLLAASGISSFAQPREIIVIRHAEKPPDAEDKGLSELGRRRATSLLKFFKENPETSRSWPPIAIYATGLGKGGKGQRCQHTVKPLSASLGVPIQTPFKAEEAADLAKQVLADEKLKGKTILICWTKERIPILLEGLGVRTIPPKLEEDQYDTVYLLKPNVAETGIRLLKEDFRP